MCILLSARNILIASALLSATAFGQSAEESTRSNPPDRTPRPIKAKCDVPETLTSFDIDSDIGSFHNVWLASWLSLIVQMPRDQFRQELLKAPFPVRKVLTFNYQRWGDQGALIESDDFNVLAFRGTQDTLDYVLNVDFVTTNGAAHGLPGRVTQGFAVGFSALWPQVNMALKSINAVSKPLLIMGHSLGGTYSQYTAERLQKSGYTIKGVYGFAAPVAGNIDFANTYNQQLKNVTFVSSYGLDITPHVPPLADNGADFLSAVHPMLRGLGALVLKGQNYASVGRYFVQGGTDDSLVEVADRKAYETKYWNTIAALGVPMPFIFLNEKRLTGDHLVENYLCSLRE